MRPINAGQATYWLGTGFNPQMSGNTMDRVPRSVRVRTDHATYPSGSANNPGYAYGTFIPLIDRGSWLHRWLAPYTLPVGPTRFNTVPMVYKNDTQWINPTRQLRIKGLTTVLPGIDTSQLDEIQAYLGNAQG